jgi:integrase
MALIETGCRPSELANITPENICLNSDVPHIKIRATPNRQLKSGASKRDIPLVGVALEAMRNSPNGFPHYRDRGYLLSQSLTKAFKARKLFPSPQHRIYSFRHSFEKRMLEAGLDYGLRCTLMGHRNPRPEYGDGGSLVYRRDEMLKIVHPVGEALLASYPFTAKPSAVRSESVKRTVCLSGEDAIPLSRLATKLRANPRNERPPRSPLSRRA